jgi:hypothetical protein
MAFTYTEDLTNDRDFVRFYAGDTVEATSALSDAIIASLLATQPSREAAVVAAAVPCRLLPLNRLDRQSLVATQEIGRAYYALIVAHDADLRDGDRAQIGGVTYEVLQVTASHTDRAESRAVIVRFG